MLVSDAEPPHSWLICHIYVRRWALAPAPVPAASYRYFFFLHTIECLWRMRPKKSLVQVGSGSSTPMWGQLLYLHQMTGRMHFLVYAVIRLCNDTDVKKMCCVVSLVWPNPRILVLVESFALRQWIIAILLICRYSNRWRPTGTDMTRLTPKLPTSRSRWVNF